MSRAIDYRLGRITSPSPQGSKMSLKLEALDGFGGESDGIRRHDRRPRR